MPAMSAPIASERPSSSAIAAVPTRKPKVASRKSSSGSRSSRRSSGLESQRDAASPAVMNPSAFATRISRLGDLAAARRREAEHQRDRDVLEDEDREHEVGLVVAEPAEVREPLHRDRARRDVDARGEDQRCGRRAERREPDDQAEPGVRDEIHRAAETDVAPGPRQPALRELEAEEEEEEDEPELRDEVRDLGRLDEREHLRLVRAEQQPRQEVRGDRGQPDPPRDEPEDAEQRDGDGELGERHAAILAARAARAPRLAKDRLRGQEARSSAGGNRSSTHSDVERRHAVRAPVDAARSRRSPGPSAAATRRGTSGCGARPASFTLGEIPTVGGRPPPRGERARLVAALGRQRAPRLCQALLVLLDQRPR